MAKHVLKEPTKTWTPVIASRNFAMYMTRWQLVAYFLLLNYIQAITLQSLKKRSCLVLLFNIIVNTKIKSCLKLEFLCRKFSTAQNQRTVINKLLYILSLNKYQRKSCMPNIIQSFSTVTLLIIYHRQPRTSYFFNTSTNRIHCIWYVLYSLWNSMT